MRRLKASSSNSRVERGRQKLRHYGCETATDSRHPEPRKAGWLQEMADALEAGMLRCSDIGAKAILGEEEKKSEASTSRMVSYWTRIAHLRLYACTHVGWTGRMGLLKVVVARILSS